MCKNWKNSGEIWSNEKKAVLLQSQTAGEG